MELLAFKILVSFGVAVFLLFLAERKSIRLSGILSSLPNVSLVVMFFIGMEQGSEFSQKASVFSIYGILANVLAATACVFLVREKKTGPAMLGFVVLGYFALLALMVGFFPDVGELALAMTFCLWAGGVYLLRGVPLVQVSNPFSSSSWQLALKFLVVTGAVLFTTWVAPRVGLEWAGALSTFPSVTLPVAVLIAMKYRAAVFASFLKSALWAWMPTAFYFYFTSFYYEREELVLGTVYSALLCLAVVLAMEAIRIALLPSLQSARSSARFR